MDWDRANAALTDLARREVRREVERLQRAIQEQIAAHTPWERAISGLDRHMDAALITYTNAAQEFEAAIAPARPKYLVDVTALDAPSGQREYLPGGPVKATLTFEEKTARLKANGARPKPAVFQEDGLWHLREWPGWSTTDECLARAVHAYLQQPTKGSQ